MSDISTYDEFGRAEALCRRALAKDPTVVKAYLNLALLDWRQKRYADAQVKLEQARALEPNNAAIYAIFGLIAQAQNQLIEAEHYFSEAVALNPQDMWVYGTYGLVLEQNQKYQQALAAHRQVLRLGRNFDTIWHYYTAWARIYKIGQVRYILSPWLCLLFVLPNLVALPLALLLVANNTLDGLFIYRNLDRKQGRKQIVLVFLFLGLFLAYRFTPAR